MNMTPSPGSASRSNDPESDTPSPSRIVSIPRLWFRGVQGTACPTCQVPPPPPFPSPLSLEHAGQLSLSHVSRPSLALAGPGIEPQSSFATCHELMPAPESIALAVTPWAALSEGIFEGRGVDLTEIKWGGRRRMVLHGRKLIGGKRKIEIDRGHAPWYTMM